MDIAVIINQMVQLFLIIALGYVLYRLHIFDQTFNKRLATLLLNVTTPAMIINSVFVSESNDSFQTIIFVFIVAFAVFLILPIISFFLVKGMRIPKPQQGLYMFMTVFSNIGFMGFPVMQAIFGDRAVFYTAIFNMAFNILIFSIGIVIMNYGTENKTKLNLKNALTPGVIASFIAVIIYFTKLSFPDVVVNSFSMIGGITTPMAMLLIGSTLANMPIKEVFNDLRVYPYAIIKQVILPIAAFPLLQWIIKDTYLLGITFIVLAMPVANSAVLFATEYGGDIKLAAKTVFITTLLSVVTIPALVYLFLM